MRKWILALWIVALVVPIEAFAHKIPCKHTHLPDRRSKTTICRNVGAVCTNGTATGECVDVLIATSLKACRCQKATTCGYEEITYYVPSTPGVPKAGDVRVYKVDEKAENFLAAIGPADEVTQIPADAGVISGSMTLVFGDSDDPAKIPVVLKDMWIELASFEVLGIETGRNFVRLGNAGPQKLIYNAKRGLLEPAAGKEGIQLAMDNAMAVNAPVTTWFDAFIDDEGRVTVNGSSEAPLPLVDDLADVFGFDRLLR